MLDTFHKTKKMERYMGYIRYMEQRIPQREQYLKEQAERKSSPAFKQDVLRRKLLQTLDLNNRKYNPSNRIANTIEFMLNTLECIYNELHSLDHEITDNEAIDFMSNYHIHYEVIQKFDDEVDYDTEQGYTRDLQLEYLEKLANIEPKLMHFFIKENEAETPISI